MKKLKLLLLSCVFTIVMIGNVFASVNISKLEEIFKYVDANKSNIAKGGEVVSTFNFKETEDSQATLYIDIAYGDIIVASGLELELCSDLNGDIDVDEHYPYNYKGVTYYVSEDGVEQLEALEEDEEQTIDEKYASIRSAIEAYQLKQKGYSDAAWAPLVKDLASEVDSIKHGMKDEGINPTWAVGAQYMNNQGAGIKQGINLAFSVFLWFLWVAFLGFELINGAIILFPVVRDKVTGDGATIPWYITHNTAERLKNMEEEPMKKWLTGEISRIITFFLISVGIFSGLFMAIFSFVLSLLPGAK